MTQILHKPYNLEKISVWNLPNHCISLLVNSNSDLIFSQNFSTQILETISSAYSIDLSDISFSNIVEKFSQLEKIDRNLLTLLDSTKKFEFERVEKVEAFNQFSIKGDIISFWLPGYHFPVKIEFFGETVEKCYLYDSLSGRKIQNLDHIILFKKIPDNASDFQSIKIEFGLKENPQIKKIIASSRVPEAINEYYKNIHFVKTDLEFPPLFFGNEIAIKSYLSKFNGFKIIVKTSSNLDLVKSLKLNSNFKNSVLRFDNGDLEVNFDTLTNMPAGFISKSNKFIFLTDRELYSKVDLKTTGKYETKSFLKNILRNFEGSINVEDFVVHEDHGIGIYKGLKQEKIDDDLRDYALIEYADGDSIYVPLTELSKITKYFAVEGNPPKLSSLGKKGWSKAKEKVKKETSIIAKELIKHFAKRSTSKAYPILKTRTELYNQIEERFEFPPTKDQLKAITEVLEDLEKDNPMNRLLVGDVGFGKTEVIIRAAASVVESGGQVAILAPTTILVEQHYSVFKERFKNLNVNVKALSRFKGKKENDITVEEVNAGSVDIIIGTHRLLSNNIKFKKLQLLVVDEEQKFGVKQKEKIKQINTGVHVLNVSATPIPRSLYIALSGINDISLITTPPAGRKAVHTEIIFQDWEKAVNKIQIELNRKGQVYFVHNRVASIQHIYAKITSFMPGVKFAIAHGQMSSTELDRIIYAFYKREYDVLISTSIIENGLDIPNVNTIIIHDSQLFGLSQLYQMRGRVGRSDSQAFCYFMCPKPKSTKIDDLVSELDSKSLTQQEYFNAVEGIKQQNKKSKLYLERLETIVANQDVGAGFHIASRDMEIRGAGSILGEDQSGHINGVGYVMYIQLLANEIDLLKNSSNG